MVTLHPLCENINQRLADLIEVLKSHVLSRLSGRNVNGWSEFRNFSVHSPNFYATSGVRHRSVTRSWSNFNRASVSAIEMNCRFSLLLTNPDSCNFMSSPTTWFTLQLSLIRHFYRSWAFVPKMWKTHLECLVCVLTQNLVASLSVLHVKMLIWPISARQSSPGSTSSVYQLSDLKSFHTRCIRRNAIRFWVWSSAEHNWATYSSNLSLDEFFLLNETPKSTLTEKQDVSRMNNRCQCPLFEIDGKELVSIVEFISVIVGRYID